MLKEQRLINLLRAMGASSPEFVSQALQVLTKRNDTCVKVENWLLFTKGSNAELWNLVEDRMVLKMPI